MLVSRLVSKELKQIHTHTHTHRERERERERERIALYSIDHEINYISSTNVWFASVLSNEGKV